MRRQTNRWNSAIAKKRKGLLRIFFSKEASERQRELCAWQHNAERCRYKASLLPRPILVFDKDPVMWADLFVKMDLPFQRGVF